MARRRNAIFHRLTRMRGLPPEEKMLMQRIGHLLDAALNNRQASNPFEPSKNKRSRVLYPPTGLVAFTGFRTLKLVWTAPDSDQHLRYEIVIQNNDTGVTETKTSFTNEFRFKGANGSYTAKVKSVGRDGSSSPIKTIDFTLGSSVMQIEGSKNGPTALGTRVQDHITVYDGYSVYAWASVVLDKYTAGSSNEQVVFRLWSMEGENQTFDSSQATLEQTITMYPATESMSNLDATARAGTITRPTGTRSGSFETSQSVMFSPISISTTEAEVVFTYFLEAINRETEQDEVNLSLVLWGGFDGLGDAIPQDPWDGGRADYVFPHLNSLRVWREEADGAHNVTKGRWFMAKQAKEFNVIDNAWTLAFWVRLENKHVGTMVDTAAPNDLLADHNIVFRRSSYNASDPWSFSENFIEVDLWGQLDGGIYRQRISVTVGDANGSDAEGYIGHTDTFGSPPNSDDDSFLWADNQEFAAVNYAWQFIVVCFEGGPLTGASASPKIRVYTNDRLDDGTNNAEERYYHTNGMQCLNQIHADEALTPPIVQVSPATLLNKLNQDITNDYVYSIGAAPSFAFANGVYKGDGVSTGNGSFTIHQMGMWNVAVDNWDGAGFNPGVAEQRDSSPWYKLPYNGSFNPLHTDGRENADVGSSLTALHYLYNMGWGTDIDWRKNSNVRADGAQEYIFAENLIHLWQFGAVPEAFAVGAETLRDTGRYIFGGDVNFLSTIEPANSGVSTNSWDDDGKLSDIFSPARMDIANPNESNAGFDPGPWASSTLPNWTSQTGTIQPAGDPNAGTTATHLSYPGQGKRQSEHSFGGSGASMDWRRPNTTDGVLDEPKTHGPVHESTSLAQAEIDVGASAWP